MTTLRLNKLLQPAVALAVIIVSALPDTNLAQHCGCAPSLCCSRWGYCGTGDAYCGISCQAGPCSTLPPASNVLAADVVTETFFDGKIGQAPEGCEGKAFYSRGTFLEAVGSYPLFGRVGSVDDSLREMAAFFGHVTFETGHMCSINEIDGASMDYCDETATQYPCNPSKGYYGRGALQLSWNFNYGPAGESIGFDGLNSPETVATDPLISFKASLWYWMNFIHPVMDQGFGATIRAMNGALKCGGKNPASVQAQVQYHTEYCNQLGVPPGDKLTC
ncbi:hypothetical protein BT93_A0004 [Corymbia citriodora subsp. variegata]|nr:hypothetical protein BT93_A0004 [Corymbia citriodora subsp. variegata]